MDVFSSSEFVLRKDILNRLYTVINLPQDKLTVDYDLASDTIRKYVNKVNHEFFKIGLQELARVEAVTKIDEFNFYIRFGFKLFDSETVAKQFLNSLRNIGIIGLILILFKFLSMI